MSQETISKVDDFLDSHVSVSGEVAGRIGEARVLI